MIALCPLPLSLCYDDQKLIKNLYMKVGNELESAAQSAEIFYGKFCILDTLILGISIMFIK